MSPSMPEGSARPLMLFGKYKGKLLAEIPSDYLRWLLSLDDLRLPLRAQVEEEYRRRDLDKPDDQEVPF